MDKQTVKSSTNDHKKASTHVKNIRMQSNLATKAVSKADKAREIFKRMYGKEGVERKDIVKVFQDEAKCTVKGSQTYYFNCKREYEDGKL